MARAFAIFANGGRAITPYAIRTIEDRVGNVILNPEADNRAAIAALGDGAQVISPQNAFIMTSLLQAGARMGTLSASAQNGRIFTYKTADNKSYTLPVSGKTGTTQNWGDAWVVGSSPWLTTAVWFGFDRKGRSLGRDLTGAQLSGGAWARFMLPANEDYPSKGFPPSPGGLVYAEVCSVSGQLLTPECGGYRTSQWFLAGTSPTEPCTLHANLITTRTIMADRLEREYLGSGVGLQQLTAGSLLIDLSFLYPPEEVPEEIPDDAFDEFGDDEWYYPPEGAELNEGEQDVIILQLEETPVIIENKIEEVADVDHSQDEPLPLDLEGGEGRATGGGTTEFNEFNDADFDDAEVAE
jgi:penicillin-binding protein 1A